MNTNNVALDKAVESALYPRTRSMLNSRHNLAFVLMVILMIGVGCIRIISTYSAFWQTWDEPFHIAAGLEWLDKGMYTYEPYHPPLARVMSAIGPYLNGVRIVDGVSAFPPIVYEGNAILYTGGAYERNLTSARIGILPFFIIASLVVALWAKTYGGTLTSLLATLLFTTLPPILAHSGFTTLDMACAALVAAALYALNLWLRKPTLLYGVLLGIVVGLAAVSKLQSLGFLLVAGCLTIVIYRLDLFRKTKLLENTDAPRFKQWFGSLLIAMLLCGLTVWAGYRFSVGHLLTLEGRPHEKIDHIVGHQGVLHGITYFILENAPIPAPEFVTGVQDFFIKNSQGHLDYFMGDIRTNGWWYYFPIIFLLKTPLPFILLSATGFFFVFRDVFRSVPGSIQSLIPVISSIGIIAISTLGKHNNGIRQILSVYPLLAIVAGYGALKLLSINKKLPLVGLGLVTILFSWQLVSSFIAHPDYLAYFNELADNHPEKIAVDSDLDWGQDLKRLSSALSVHGVDEVKIKYHGSVGLDLTLFGLPPMQELKPYQKETGWVAISIYSLTLGTGQAPYDQYSWLSEYQPVERVGKSIWLYHIPEN